MSLLKIVNTIYPYRQLLVAFSGGLDSTVLLHQLMLLRKKKLNIELRAIHIHHGLSTNADKWVSHCKKVCRNWNIPLLIKYINVINNKFGVEGQARKLRYAAFNESLLPGEVLVTAQHLDDQIETFLLALKRGSGPTGLSSMPTKIAFAGTQLLRPFLTETRATLLCLAQKYNLHWIEDEGNKNEKYDRIFLRMHIVPLLIQRWPHFAKAVARSAMLCAEQERLLDELLNDELLSIITDNKTLAITPLVSMTMQRRAALIRRWLAVHGAPMPSRMMLNRIWTEVVQARRDASPCLYMNGYTIRRFRRQLWYVSDQPSLRNIIINWIDTNNILLLPHNAGCLALTEHGNIRLPLPNEKVTIRFKATGKLYIIGRSSRCKLKKIWQERKIPPWLRDTTPLLFYNETLISAAGVFVTREGWIENGIQLKWTVT